MPGRMMMVAAKKTTTKATGKKLIDPGAKKTSAKAKTKNERNTENVVRDALRDCGYYDDNPIHVEEQKSAIEAVQKALRAGSKKGGSGRGFPEFIISSPSTPDVLLVVECKASPNDHQS